MKRKVTTTVRRKPNKKPPRKTNKERKHQAWKEKNSNMENRRTKQPNVKATWIREGDVRKLVSRKEEQSEERKGARNIEQKNESDNVISQGVDEGQKKHGIFQVNTEEKEETTKNEKQRRVMKKGLWGKKRCKTSLLNCRTQLLCITDSKTRP